MADSIIKIKGTDLISESVNSINTNFETLYNRDSQYEQKLKSYTDLVDNTVKGLKDTINLNKTDIDQSISGLSSQLENIATVTNIQTQVESAIENAEGVLANVIATNAGRYVENAMSAYAKTAIVDEKFENYTSSNAFTTYESNVLNKKFASANTIVANNKFYKEFNPENNKYCFVYKEDSEHNITDGTISQFDSIESYYNELTATEKNQLDTNHTGNGLNDDTVVKNLIAECERHFKIASTELAAVTQTVSDKSATINLVAAVMSDKDPNTTLAAAILMEANDVDSSIKLNANKINIDAANKLNLTAQNCTISVASNFTINASNFKINSSGDVTVAGDITASSGKIGEVEISNGGLRSKNVGTAANQKYNFILDSSGNLSVQNATIAGSINATSLTIGSSAESTLTSLIMSVGASEGWSNGASNNWLVNSFQQTEVSGGVVLTGNVFVADENGDYCAGMLGTREENSIDVRFFAGIPNSEEELDLRDVIYNAPFKVYEDGFLQSTYGEIGTVAIGSEGLYCGNVHLYDKGIEIEDTYGNKSEFTSDGIRLAGSVAFRTAYLFNVNISDGWDDWWTEDLPEENLIALDNLEKQHGIFAANNDKSIETAILGCDIINIFGITLTIPNDSRFIGRRVTFMSGHPLAAGLKAKIEGAGFYCDYDLTVTDNGYIRFADSECLFYEDGNYSKKINLSNEAIECFGMGVGNEFKGFIITNRYNIKTTYDYGHPLRCLGMYYISNKSLTKGYSFNGATVNLSTHDDYLELSTPFKVSATSDIITMVEDYGSETSGNGWQVTEQVNSGNHQLSVRLYNTDLSSSCKVMIFNAKDFTSLYLDPSLDQNPPAIDKVVVKRNDVWDTKISTLSWDCDSTSAYPETIRVYTNSSTTEVDFQITSGSSYFTLTDADSTGVVSKVITSSYCTFPTIKPKTTNNGYNNYNATLTIIAKNTGSGETVRTSVSLIQERKYSGGGGGGGTGSGGHNSSGSGYGT